MVLLSNKGVSGLLEGNQNDLDETMRPRHYEAEGTEMVAAVCRSLRLSYNWATGTGIHQRSDSSVFSKASLIGE